MKKSRMPRLRKVDSVWRNWEDQATGFSGLIIIPKQNFYSVTVAVKGNSKEVVALKKNKPTNIKTPWKNKLRLHKRFSHQI